VAAEVAQAYAQAHQAARRADLAEAGLRAAAASAEKNLAALSATREKGGVVQTLVRPLEAVAAVQALAQAYSDYYGAVADYDRAQFRLYRALGQSAGSLAGALPACTSPGPDATSLRARLGMPVFDSEPNSTANFPDLNRISEQLPPAPRLRP
jgi:hypothetical protein